MMKNLPLDNMQRMTKETFNPKLRAVVSIRNLVVGLSSDWKGVKSTGSEIDKLIQDIGNFFMENASISAHPEIRSELKSYQDNFKELRKIMNEVVHKINSKDPNALDVVWERHIPFAEQIEETFKRMERLGSNHLPRASHEKWKSDWCAVHSKFNANKQIAESSGLYLKMIGELAPEEIDELTENILTHMPVNYSLEDAEQYEKEYMDAYEQLKNQASKSKTLWDKFLDLLAGGTQQTPAEMVMMQRWVNGEKGDL